MVLLTKASVLCLLCLISTVVGLRTVREERESVQHLPRRSQKKAGHFKNGWTRGMDPDEKELTCSDVRSIFEEHELMEEHKRGECGLMYSEDTDFAIQSDSPCAEEISAAVTKFCQELPRLDLINRALYGKQLRCTDGDWDTRALQSIEAFKIVNDMQVRTTAEDWDSMDVKQSQFPIVEYFNIVTMNFNVEMAGEEETTEYDCVASDSEKKWGISREMQDQAKSKSCKAWQLQQQNMKKEVTASDSTAAAAHNFCRLLSQDAFHLKSSEIGDSALYFRCMWHPKNAFRLLASIGGITKMSMKYVHEVLGEGGFFNMSLSAEDEEFLGPQWYLWGDVSVDHGTGGTTTLRSDGLTVKLPHKTTPTEFTLEAADAGSIATVEFSPEYTEGYEEDREAKNLQLQNPQEGDRLWDERCPKINKEWQRHPCAYELAMWVADFCTTFSHKFVLQQTDKSSSKLKMQCVTYGHTSPMWITEQLVTLPEEVDVGEQEKKGDGSLYQYVDLSSQTLNMLVEYGNGFESCMKVDLPKHKALHWRDDKQKLEFSA